MSSRPTANLLDDILEAMARIRSYIGQMSEGEFLSDGKTQDAVIRNLEIIGEAAHRLPEDFRQAKGQVDWRAVIGLRHRLIHGYFGVDSGIIWHVVSSDLDHLESAIQILRKSLP